MLTTSHYNCRFLLEVHIIINFIAFLYSFIYLLQKYRGLVLDLTGRNNLTTRIPATLGLGLRNVQDTEEADLYLNDTHITKKTVSDIFFQTPELCEPNRYCRGSDPNTDTQMQSEINHNLFCISFCFMAICTVALWHCGGVSQSRFT